MIISSQKYLDSATVAAKSANGDYVVSISPAFFVDGTEMHVVLDGHHSLAAAKADGVDPVFNIATKQDDDRICLLDQSVDKFLEACYMDTDWYDTATGTNVF